MCKQENRACLTRNCNGFAQILRFFPCKERPNCRVEQTPIPRYLRTSYAYCPECKLNAGRQRKIYKAASRKARRNGAEDSVAVEQQAESSTMGERRNAVVGGFLPDSNHTLSTPKRNSSYSLNSRAFQRNSEIVSVFNGTKVDAPANKKRPSTNSYPAVTHGPPRSNPNTIASAPSHDPRSINSFQARSSRPSPPYGIPPQSNIPSTWQKEQQNQPPSPAQSSNHEPASNTPSPAFSSSPPHPPILAQLLPSSTDPFLTSEEDNFLGLDPRAYPRAQRRQAFLRISDQILAEPLANAEDIFPPESREVLVCRHPADTVFDYGSPPPLNLFSILLQRLTAP